MKSIQAFLLALTLGGTSYAALPPLGATYLDLRGIFKSDKPLNALGEKTMAAVSQVQPAEDGGGGYILVAGDCRIRVVPVYEKLPDLLPGTPDVIDVKVSKAVCK